MKSTTSKFPTNVVQALHDAQLQKAITNAKTGFIDKRRNAINDLPEFEYIRKTARQIKEHTLQHLDEYLIYFEQKVIDSGGQVHWAQSPDDATAIVVEVCSKINARKVTKGKTMVGEEVGLNDALLAAGIIPVETDLGEYIIQLAGETPSHIIVPAVHKTREQISSLFHQHHARYGLTKPLDTVPDIVNEARKVLREEFINADAGITGANLLIAETGSTVLVTNEGNGDLTASLPRVHIVIASIEKVVPTLEDANTLLRLLARSATGQETTAYTTFFSGPKHQSDLDGPEEFHVVLVDNSRSEMLGNAYREMLNCIHCGACLNHCPVYSAIGGHAYGWVYPGPMGAVLTPIMTDLEASSHLPQASSLCSRCQEVCPMSIPLPNLLREHRFRTHQQKIDSSSARWILAIWAYFAKRPKLYRLFINNIIRILSKLAGRKGKVSKLPFANGWTNNKDFPAPQGETFISTWMKNHSHVENSGE